MNDVVSCYSMHALHGGEPLSVFVFFSLDINEKSHFQYSFQVMINFIINSMTAPIFAKIDLLMFIATIFQHAINLKIAKCCTNKENC